MMMDFNRSMLRLVAFTLLFIFTTQCEEPFNADVPLRDINVLIVEGYINAGPGISTFRLSHATPLNTATGVLYEKNAEVSIESSSSEAFKLTETSPGIYKSAELGLSLDNAYRLYVKLQNGKEYRSQFLPVKVTPTIDSITWELRPDQLYIVANTHDPLNATHYYRWEFEEDWRINSPYISELKYQNDTIVERPFEEKYAMYNCWGASKPNNLILGSTDGFVTDNINFPVQSLPYGAEKISVRYSILVRQHALQKDEYEYLKLILKNASQVGSWFDPMPSQLFGNIVSMDDENEKVIGYVGAYTTETKRIYIDARDLPVTPTQISCNGPDENVDFVFNTDSLQYYFGNNLFTPTAIYIDPTTRDLRVSGTNTYCYDCRLRGTNIQPDFWE